MTKLRPRERVSSTEGVGESIHLFLLNYRKCLGLDTLLGACPNLPVTLQAPLSWLDGCHHLLRDQHLSCLVVGHL